MRRPIAGLGLMVAVACAATAQAQPPQAGAKTGGTLANAVGCLEQGSKPHSFVLRTSGTPPGAIELVGPGKTDVNQHVGRMVEVSGVIASQGARMTARNIRPTAGSCAAPQPAGTTAGAPAGSAASGAPASGSAPSSPAGTTTTPSSTTSATDITAGLGQTGVTGDALLDGLINFNIQQLLVSIQLTANVNVQDTVINVTDVLNDVQIQALVQALNTNPQASMNATELTFALQQAGMLAPGETVVGVAPETIRDNQTLTAALQQQGILQPTERVVGVKRPRVVKLKS